MAISEARQRANAKYNKKAYDRLEMKVPKGKKADIINHAAKQGESLNKFLNRAVENQIIIDNDSDYTKLTPKEAKELAEAENSGYIDEENIDWDNLDKMNLD